jgi:hypothetical protein
VTFLVVLLLSVLLFVVRFVERLLTEEVLPVLRFFTLEVFLLEVEGLLVFLEEDVFLLLNDRLLVEGLVVDLFVVLGLLVVLGRLILPDLDMERPPPPWLMRCACICSGVTSNIAANNNPIPNFK